MPPSNIAKRILQTILLAQSGQAGNVFQAQQEAEQRLEEINARSRLEAAMEELRQGGRERLETQKAGHRKRVERVRQRGRKRLEKLRQKGQVGLEEKRQGGRREIEGIRQQGRESLETNRQKNRLGVVSARGEQVRQTERLRGEERRKGKLTKPVFPTLDQFREEVEDEARASLNERTRGAARDMGELPTQEDRISALDRVVQRLTGKSSEMFEFTNEVDLYRQLLEDQRSAQQPPAEADSEAVVKEAIARARARAGL